MASDYDRCFGPQYLPWVNFFKEFVPMKRDDQVVDIGGGTAQISLTIKDHLKMTKPIVCVDPSQELIDIAKKNGATTVRATAEEFFASEPIYSLDLVFMTCCIHHFKDPDFVFTALAKYMPQNGVCAVVQTSFPSNLTLPWFKSSKHDYPVSEKQDSIMKLVQSKGLECKSVFAMERVEVEKELWYDTLRKRFRSTLRLLSDEEIEDGIRELEGTFKDADVLKLDMAKYGLIITKGDIVG